MRLFAITLCLLLENVTTNPVDNNASPETLQLYNILLSYTQKSNKTLFGHHDATLFGAGGGRPPYILGDPHSGFRGWLFSKLAERRTKRTREGAEIGTGGQNSKSSYEKLIRDGTFSLLTIALTDNDDLALAKYPIIKQTLAPNSARQLTRVVIGTTYQRDPDERNIPSNLLQSPPRDIPPYRGMRHRFVVITTTVNRSFRAHTMSVY
ncbi:hypothetical protein CHS0354_022132 [Potamilus streckersoni]|uniref:Secreted protein n=1 Tax=Potamilus streckersoni TaxID=2493646 RepID=A0AAE0RT11_9BIVA|nr:hypothetical protein CHS0354_022132 [Potamilus streckersoni]